jgi:SAM-dependent methyltransferase
MAERKHTATASSRSWDPVAEWYTGWVGAGGSEHHRRLAIPAVLELLAPSAGELILDVGCGPGVLAPHIAGAGARYIGLDASRRLLSFARRHHGRHGRFVLGDATRLVELPGLEPGSVDAVVFMLSIQDIDPLEAALEQSSRTLRPGGRMVLLLTHPCFRVPRQSGWGWDERRRLQYRRVDQYLTPLAVPMKPYGDGRRGATRSHHRPLESYVNALTSSGLVIDGIREVPTYRSPPPGPRMRAERRALREIPLFLGLRAVTR